MARIKMIPWLLGVSGRPSASPRLAPLREGRNKVQVAALLCSALIWLRWGVNPPIHMNKMFLNMAVWGGGGGERRTTGRKNSNEAQALEEAGGEMSRDEVRSIQGGKREEHPSTYLRIDAI